MNVKVKNTFWHLFYLFSYLAKLFLHLSLVADVVIIVLLHLLRRLFLKITLILLVNTP